MVFPNGHVWLRMELDIRPNTASSHLSTLNSQAVVCWPVDWACLSLLVAVGGLLIILLLSNCSKQSLYICIRRYKYIHRIMSALDGAILLSASAQPRV